MTTQTNTIKRYRSIPYKEAGKLGYRKIQYFSLGRWRTIDYSKSKNEAIKIIRSLKR